MIARTLVLSLLLLSSCSFAQPKSISQSLNVALSEHDKAELVNVLRERNDLLSSGRVGAKGKVSYSALTRSFFLSTVFLRPNSIRSELFFSESNQLVFIVTSSLLGTAAYDARSNNYYRAENEVMAVKAFFGAPFNAEELALWLMGSFVPDADKEIAAFVDSNGNKVLSLENLSGRVVYLVFDESMRVASMEVWEGGEFIIQTRYSYKELGTTCSSLALPVGLQIELLKQDLNVDLQVQRCTTNDPRLKPDSRLFNLAIPSNAKTFEVKPSQMQAW